MQPLWTVTFFASKIPSNQDTLDEQSMIYFYSLFKNIFNFTTAGDWDCVAAVERLPAFNYSVVFISLFFAVMGFIVELWNY